MSGEAEAWPGETVFPAAARALKALGIPRELVDELRRFWACDMLIPYPPPVPRECNFYVRPMPPPQRIAWAVDCHVKRYMPATADWKVGCDRTCIILWHSWPPSNHVEFNHEFICQAYARNRLHGWYTDDDV
jgi:hypothetical protein